MNIQKLIFFLSFVVLTTFGGNCQLMERPGSHSVIHNMEEDRQSYMSFFDGHPAAMFAQFKKSNEGKHFMAAKTDHEVRYWLGKFLTRYYDTTKQKKGGKG